LFVSFAVLTNFSESSQDEMEVNHQINNIDKDHTLDVEDFNIHQLFKSPSLTTTTASSNKQKYRVLGTLSLLGVSFMAACGGPFGSEMLISAGGPLIGLLSIATYILLCMIPISYVIAELCCAFPQNGGFAVWTMAAFGPFWGFQVGYWAWIASAINSGFSPSLVYFIITNALGVQLTSSVTTYFLKVAIALLLALPSYVGVRFIGVASLIMMVLVLAIMVIFSVWGLSGGDGAFFRLGETRALSGSSSDKDGDNVDWTRLISFLITCFGRVQWISMIGGEVRNPARTYPRVILFTIMLSIVVYVAAFIVTVIGDKMPWRAIAPGLYPVVASALGGSGLHGVMVFCAIITYSGIYANTVFLQSFLVQGMAQSQLLPRIFRKRSQRFKTPQYAIAANLLTTMVVIALDLDTLMSMINAFTCAVQIMMILSMIKLRRVFPYMHRPVRMPGNLVVIMIMLIPAFSVCLFVIGSTIVVDWKIGRLVLAFVVPGLFIPFVRKWFAGRRICG
jgi:amino acid transporter